MTKDEAQRRRWTFYEAVSLYWGKMVIKIVNNFDGEEGPCTQKQ